MDNGEEKGLKVEARSLAPQEGHGVQCTGGGLTHYGGRDHS